MAGGYRSNDPLAGKSTGGSSPSSYRSSDPLGHTATAASGSGGHGIGHWLGSKIGLAAHDIKSIPGGLYTIGKTGGNDVVAMAEGAPLSDPRRQAADRLGRSILQSTVTSLEHPLRDPFQTLTVVLPFLRGAASTAARAGAVADAARAGDGAAEVAKAGLRTPKIAPRVLTVGDTHAPLRASRNPAVRAAQAAYDKALQHGIDTNPDGRIAAHAMKRVGGSLAETTRFQTRMRAAVADDLERAGRKLGSRKVAQAALRLTSENSTPEEAAAFHRAQAAQGVGVRANRAMAHLYDRVAEMGVLTRDAHGNVIVDAARHPEIAEVDAKLAAGQTRVDQILREHELMTEEGMATRRDAPGQIRRAVVDEQVRNGRPIYEPQGRGYVPYRLADPKASKSSVAASTGPVVGLPRDFVGSKAFTGEGLAKGLVPDDTTGLFARHLRRALRFVATDQFRRSALQTGSAVRRSSRDVLVRIPGEKAAQLSLELEDALGRKHANLDEINAHEQAMSGLLDRLIPGRGDNFLTDKAQAIGTKAPAGYKWVDQNVLGDTATFQPRPRGKIAKTIDSVNSAVTAATVYFKIGHIGTRVLTNGATTIIQGSAAPLELGKSVRLWKQLSFADQRRALGAAGQHGYEAMPHEGDNVVGRIATHGANWWAKHIDAPFRFASIAYEARRAGFDTPAKFRDLLNKLGDTTALPAAERARIEQIAKDANRAGIAYDRLSPVERNYIARGVWFYPWIAGSSRFAAYVLAEHPLQAAVLTAAGVRGREQQQNELGDLPSYEQGLFRLAGGAHPLVADFSTFSPFATPADALDAVARPGDLAGFLNPVVGAGRQLVSGENQYGSKSKTPYLDALLALAASTPEQQIADAVVNRKADQSSRMFRKTPGSALARLLGGPGLPRRINPDAAHKAALRERQGR